MTREHALCPKCEHFFGAVPRNRGKVLMMIGALGLGGFRSMRTYESGTLGEEFLSFVHEVLVPRFSPGDVVVMDNLGTHHATGVRVPIGNSGARIVYHPPYSPDFNPIQMCWSKVKSLLRFFAARTIPSLVNAVFDAVAAVTTSDARAWLDHAGYPRCA